jgi:hypothetical protein
VAEYVIVVTPLLNNDPGPAPVLVGVRLPQLSVATVGSVHEAIAEQVPEAVFVTILDGQTTTGN